MADLTTEFVANLKTLRDAEAVAVPGGTLDTTTLVSEDVPVKRAAAAGHVVKDLNTVYEVAL